MKGLVGIVEINEYLVWVRPGNLGLGNVSRELNRPHDCPSGWWRTKATLTQMLYGGSTHCVSILKI